MAKIKIEDLPKDARISQEEMKRVFGGYKLASLSIDLRVFPKFEDTDMRFKSSEPDESGAQKLNISF